METKLCSKCKNEKELSNFSKDSGNKDSLYSWCKACVKLHQKENKDRIRIQQKSWRKKNKIHVAKYTKRYDLINKKKRTLQKRLHRQKFSDIYKDKKLRKLFGITYLDYYYLLESQNGVCAICGKEETLRHFKYGTLLDLAVDHDHKTGKVRGLLCSDCNKGIGIFQDNPERLQTAINYLNRNK
jgi:hypothetical protein